MGKMYRAPRPKSGLSQQQKSQVKALVRKQQETKFVGLSYAAQPIQDALRTPVDTDMNGVAVGTGYAARIGHQITVTGYHGEFMFTGADATNIMRMVIYVPKDPDDSLSADITGVTTLIDLDRYTVLMDRLIGTTSGGVNQQRVVFKKKFAKGNRRGMQTQFFGTNATDFSKNRLRLYITSDSGAISDPTVSGRFRCYYKDA